MDDNIRRKPDFNTSASGGNASAKFVDDILQAANLQQWNKLRRLFDENKTFDAPYDPRTLQVVLRASEAGQLAVVEEMFRRNFRFTDKAEGSDLIERLAKDSDDAAIPVIGFLVKNNHASAEQAVLSAAREGTHGLMQRLKDNGADISARGTSFSVAFYAGNKEMMRYLFNQDMTLYPASVIAGLHGRRDSFGDRFRSVNVEETVAFYGQLVAEDVQRLGLFTAYVCPNKPSLDDLRSVPYGVQEKSVTLMHLLARTGDADDIIKAAFREDKSPLTVEDLLRQDKDGVSVLAILAARGEEQKLVDARLWLHNPAAVKEVNEALKDLRAGVSIDSNVFESDLVFYRLKKKFDPSRWSLTPKRPDKQ